MLETFWNEF